MNALGMVLWVVVSTLGPEPFGSECDATVEFDPISGEFSVSCSGGCDGSEGCDLTTMTGQMSGTTATTCLCGGQLGDGVCTAVLLEPEEGDPDVGCVSRGCESCIEFTGTSPETGSSLTICNCQDP